jgi:hypothetical protein
MLTLIRNGNRASSHDMQFHLYMLTRRELALGSIHVTMTRLQRRQLVDSWLGTPSPSPGGKAIRYYAVTDRGLSALRSLGDEFARAWRGLQV